jgi:hypothetical protein
LPTYERSARFDRDWRGLADDERERFRGAARRFIEDLPSGSFRAGLRVKGVTGAPGVFELTWSPDGRATFEYGKALGQGPHIVWRRIGTHEVLRAP